MDQSAVEGARIQVLPSSDKAWSSTSKRLLLSH
jgi:hypothetical protein